MSNSLRTHGLQHARLPCPSPTNRVHPNPCPLSRWCHPTISSSVIPFSSCPQSFPFFFILFKNSQKFRWLCEIFWLYHLSFKFMKSLQANSMPTKQSSTRVLILPEVIMFTKFDLWLFIFYYFPPIFWSCLTWFRASCNIFSSLILFSWTLTMILDFFKKKKKKRCFWILLHFVCWIFFQRVWTNEH